jgi:hypothetical protein
MNNTFGSFCDTMGEEYEAMSEASEYIPPPETPKKVREPTPRTPDVDTPEMTPAPTTPAKKTPPRPAPRSETPPKPIPEPVYGTLEELHKTPRTNEAIRRAGLTWDQLEMRTRRSFEIHGEYLPEAVEMRFKHYELRRQRKVQDVKIEKSKLIAERAHESAAPSLNALQSIEGLLDDELTRLERNLNQQVRVHTSVQRSNAAQLDKEAKLEDKIAYRANRIQVAHAQYGLKGEQLRQVSEAKHKHSAHLQKSLESERTTKQTQYIAEQLEEEVRLENHRRQQALLSSEKSEAWKAKCKTISRRKEEVDLSHEIWGTKVMADERRKFEGIDQKKQERLKEHKLRHAEAMLRHDDSKSTYARLEALARNKRQIISSNLEKEDARVRALKAVKDQVIEQRKKRLVQQAVLKSKPSEIQNITPGPGRYNANISCLNELPVTKFSTANPLNLQPGSLDSLLKASQDCPPPGAYTPNVLRKGNHLDSSKDGGAVKFGGPGAVGKKNFIDDYVAAKRDNPGPGSYDLPSSLELEHSVRFEQPKFTGLDELPSFVPRPNDVPGPDQYCVDVFTREERLKRSSTSMPSLQSALHMS